MQLKWAIIAYLPLNVNTALPASTLLYIWEHTALAMLDCHRTLEHWLYGLPSYMAFYEHTEWPLKITRTCHSGDWCLFCLQWHAGSDGEAFLHCPSADLSPAHRRKARSTSYSSAMQEGSEITGISHRDSISTNFWVWGGKDSKKKCRCLYGKCWRTRWLLLQTLELCGFVCLSVIRSSKEPLLSSCPSNFL